MKTVDVLVVGAGPAGVAAAIGLARAGLKVMLADKARFPRDKVCGDGLTAAALRELARLGLDPGHIRSWTAVTSCLVRSPSGRTIDLRLPDPASSGLFAAVARRIDLDAALVELAGTAGAEVVAGHGVTAFHADPAQAGGVRLELGGYGTVAAGMVVAADGMYSPVRKLAGAGMSRYLGEWHAFRQYYQNVDAIAAEKMTVLFEPDTLPGYFWTFPLGNGAANVGFGIARGGKVATREMKSLWPDLLTRPHIRALLGAGARAEATHKAWPIPARVDSIPLTAAGGRVLFVGDAAAAADPLTGEGIGQALLTGRLAAEAIARTNGDPPRAAHEYERETTRALVADHRMSVLLTRALKHRKGARAAVRIAGASAWTRRHFARWLFEDYPRAVLVTPRRWRRGIFSSPGAFGRDPTGRP